MDAGTRIDAVLTERGIITISEKIPWWQGGWGGSLRPHTDKDATDTQPSAQRAQSLVALNIGQSQEVKSFRRPFSSLKNEAV